MTRNTKGFIGWALVDAILTVISAFIFTVGSAAIILPMIICFCAMVCREIWQYKTGQATVFEWDDIAGYSFDILATSVIMAFILVFLGIIA